ncbi:MAG: LPS-assembly protein LptD [Alphaproteobacteria bacterium]|nr:LPS-assembly protein LptD [Alphaproteobacteria bacterium]
MLRLTFKIVSAIAAAIWVCGQVAVAATAPDEDVPVLLRADELSHDRELGIVNARGNVEVSRNDRVLLADSITYNQKDDILTAKGNVSFLEPTGEVVFSEYVELTGDFKDGLIEDIRMILSDGARLAANGARRTGGIKHEMSKAVYSPCYLCPDDPAKPPLWQIKAIKVTHDKRSRDITYEDAWLEVMGLPVAYTPFMSHPDPTVKRRTGFLVPSIGTSSDLGIVVKTPYFININPWQDITLNPIYTSEEGPVMAGEYRHRLATGELEVAASITSDSDSDVRGHVDATGEFDINNTWRWGFDANRSTDDTYLRRYGFPSSSTLTSRLFAEGFRKRNYVSANAYTFQGLQESDDPGQTPLVLPMVNYHHVGEPDSLGGRKRLDASFLSLTRNEGSDTQRISVNAGWDLPYVGPMGDIYLLSASVRGDAYHVKDLERDGNKSDYDGFSERLLYEVGLHWRYPFVRSQGRAIQVIEPMASAIISPYGGNPDTIPNEDSQDFEFDDTNLFSANRFPGLDRVEGGPRVNYGLRWGVFGLGGGHTSFLVGQSVRAKDDDTFAENSGLEGHFSDIVARARISPGKHLDLTYRTRLDKEDFAPRRNEVSVTAGPDVLRLNTNYVFFDRQPDSEFSTSREEWRSSVAAKLSRYWRSRGNYVYDVQDSEMRSYGLDLTYEDECVALTTTWGRSFFRDRDIEPTDTIFFRLNLKTLGEVSTQAL